MQQWLLQENSVTRDHEAQQKKPDLRRQTLFVLSHMQILGLNSHLCIHSTCIHIWCIYVYIYMIYMCMHMYMCMHGFESRKGTMRVGKDLKRVEGNGIHVAQKQKGCLEKRRGSAEERNGR